MKAGEFIRRAVREEHVGRFVVMADVVPAGKRWHVHNDEELPLGASLSLEVMDRLTIEGGRIIHTPKGARWTMEP